jgi:hypothetical protein
MPTIKYSEAEGVKRIITIDGKVSCECCGGEYISIRFSSDSYEHVINLETRIVDGNNSETAQCSSTGMYMSGELENCSEWSQEYFFDVAKSKSDGYWSSSFNFELWADMEAGCYGGFEPWMDDPVDGYCQPPFETYNVLVTITYKGVTKSKSYETFAMLTESLFAAHYIGALTIYESSTGIDFELV